MKNLAGFIFPHTCPPKTCPILYPNLWRGTFRGVCNTPLHAYVQNPPDFIFSHTYPPKTHLILPFPNKDSSENLPGFIPKPSPQDISGRMLLRPTRIHEKFDGFHIPAHDIARNPAGFGLCHTTWRETRRVLDFATRHGTKPGGFWTLPHDMVRNPAGFGLCHTT